MASGDHVWVLMQTLVQRRMWRCPCQHHPGALPPVQTTVPMAAGASPKTPSVFKIAGSSGLLAALSPRPDRREHFSSRFPGVVSLPPAGPHPVRSPLVLVSRDSLLRLCQAPHCQLFLQAATSLLLEPIKFSV